MDGGWNAEPGSELGQPSYQRVCDAIRTDIAAGVFGSGARLKSGDLARRYGLSLAPIREALSQLAAEGWVTIAPNRGASVRLIDEALLRNLNDVRVALESYVIRFAAEQATADDLGRLAAIQDEYDVAVDGGDAQRLVRINARFHGTIHAIRDSPEVTAIIQRQSRFFNVMRGAWGYQPGRPQQIAREHHGLLRAMRRHDGPEAERLSRAHIAHAMEDLLACLRRGVPVASGGGMRPTAHRR